MKLKLKSYGLGNEFDITKFDPIQNDCRLKPIGGLWASPIDSQYGWVDWCRENEFGNLSTVFEFEYQGNILVIDSLDDMNGITWIPFAGNFKIPDFEALAKNYDAIWLTLKGERVTKFSTPSFYGWDCESVLIFSPHGVR